MKTWPLLIGIVVILAVVSLPAAAISKADLIASEHPSYDWAVVRDYIRGPLSCGNCTPESWGEGDTAPAIRAVIPTPTPAPLTPDIYPHIPAFDPYIRASYYEYSKFLPEPTPRVVSDEEWEEARAKWIYIPCETCVGLK